MTPKENIIDPLNGEKQVLKQDSFVINPRACKNSFSKITESSVELTISFDQSRDDFMSKNSEHLGLQKLNSNPSENTQNHAKHDNTYAGSFSSMSSTTRANVRYCNAKKDEIVKRLSAKQEEQDQYINEKIEEYRINQDSIETEDNSASVTIFSTKVD